MNTKTFIKKVFVTMMALMMSLSLGLSNVSAMKSNSGKTSGYSYTTYQPTKSSETKTITLKRGAYVIQVEASSKASALMKLYKGSKRIAGKQSSKGKCTYDSVYLNSRGKYKLYIKSSDMKGRITFIYVGNGGTQTISPTSRNLVYGTSRANNKSIAYYKMVVSSPGYVNLATYRIHSKKVNYVKIYKYVNKKKVAYTGWKKDTSGLKYLGLSRGVYYVAVKSAAKAYGIRVTGYKTLSSRHRGKKNATYLKSKALAKDLIPLNSGKYTYYRFKLNKKKAIKINLNTYIYSGTVTYTIMKGSTTLKSGKLVVSNSKISTIPSVGKLAKGNYYIRVTAGKGTSGTYTVRVRY